MSDTDVATAASTPAPPVETDQQPVDQGADSGTPQDQSTDIKTADPGSQPEMSEAEKRIKQLNARLKDANKTIDILHGVLTKNGEPVSTRADSTQRQTMTDDAADLKMPKVEDFETWEAYETAKDAYTVEKTKRELRKEYYRDMRRQESQKVIDAFEDQLEREAETDPSILDLRNDKSLPVSDPMAEVIRSSEVAAKLLRWIDQNRPQAKKIALMSPYKAAAEMGKIEAEILAKPAVKVKKISDAPAPIQTVKGTVGGALSLDDEKLPLAEFIKRSNEKQYGKRR